MTFRIATWNLHGRAGDAAAQLGGLLRHQGGADVVLLQEVSVNGTDRFTEAAGLDWCVHVRQRFSGLVHARGRERGRAVAIAGRGDAPEAVFPFPDLPLVEKALAATVVLGPLRSTVLSYHAPAGVTHGVTKPKQAVQIAKWLGSMDGPMVMGGDFNTPEIDPVDDDGVRTHFHTGHPDLAGQPGDDALVGPSPVHRLRDATRLLRAGSANSVTPLTDKGPLALTYRTGDAAHQRHRYDAIWLTPDFEVIRVHHLYDEAVQAGTDHALVIAEVEIR